TRSDGIVGGSTCRYPVRPRRENIEVRGAHLGLAYNPAVLWLLGDRLGQGEGKWKPFRAPLPLMSFFPRQRSLSARPDSARCLAAHNTRNAPSWIALGPATTAAGWLPACQDACRVAPRSHNTPMMDFVCARGCPHSAVSRAVPRPRRPWSGCRPGTCRTSRRPA